MTFGKRMVIGGCGLALLVVLAIPFGGLIDSEPNEWKRLSGDGISWALPAGWVADDPFTMQTPYTTYLWFHDFPAHDTRMALIRSADRGTDLIVMFGDRATLATPARTSFTTYDDHPLVSPIGEDDLVTADAVPMHWKAVRMAPGLVGGNDVTFFLAYATCGKNALVVCGGGLTDDFDLDHSIEFLESLSLP